ncbi:23743_t:CDS:2 [Gigaspora margarita]|uniref:23743_t:CDS:1 n=1 Tax=Gigaspora margarita TaxID=4874 RepID=A0ABN7UDI9_GIGMA|nr:23743_t:CDS:2 [Gigaspora margarita]
MNDLDSDINSERAESPDASHESNCMYNNACEDDNMSYSPGILSTEKEVIPSVTLETQNAFDLMLKKKNKAHEHNNKINISYSSNKNFILPKQRDRIILDEITRQSSDTSTSVNIKKVGRFLIRSPVWKWFTEEIIDNVRHGICIIGMPNGKPYSKAIRTGDDLLSKNKKQITITKAIEISTSKPHNIVEQAICNHIVTELIIAQNLPLSLVEKKVKNLIDDRFKRICTALHNDLQQADTISLTADMWTAYSHNSYLGITVTWIDKKFELNNAVLAFTCLRYPHTADVIVKSIQDILEFWNLRNKVFSITTDSGTNIKLAYSKLGVKWVPCSAHILNLIVQKGLLPAKYLITHMNHLIKFFTTPKQGERLEKVQRSHQISNNQEKLNEKNKCRVFLHAQTDVVTQADAIADEKHLKEIMITESEWAKVASIINILKPFDDVTNYISSSSYSTMSIIYPTIISLRNVLLKLFENDNISDFISHDEETIFDDEDLTDTDKELEELKSLANTINLTNTIKKTMAETTLNIQDYLRLGYDEKTIDDTFEPLSNEVMLDMSQSFLFSIFTAQPNVGCRNEVDQYFMMESIGPLDNPLK